MKRKNLLKIFIVLVLLFLFSKNVSAIGGDPGDWVDWMGPDRPVLGCFNESGTQWGSSYIGSPSPWRGEEDVPITANGVQTCINITITPGCIANITFEWLNYQMVYDDWLEWAYAQDWWDWESIDWDSEPSTMNDSYWFSYYNESYISHTQDICYNNTNVTCLTDNDWVSAYQDWRVIANFTCGKTEYNTTCYYYYETEHCPISYIYPASPNGTGICPCCDSICFNASNEYGHNMNVTIYGSDDGTHYFTWNKYFNISNSSQCFCFCNQYLEPTPSKEGEWIGANGIQAPGAKPADLVQHGCSISWEFSDNLEEEIQFTVRIPQRMNFSLPVTLDIGWSSPATDKMCNWNLTYSLTQLDEDTYEACEYYQDVLTESSLVADGLTMYRFYLTEMVSGDRCFHFTLQRDGNDPSDNLSDVANLHGTCFSYYLDDDVIHIENATKPMQYNTTYYWYINVTDVETGEGTETDIFQFRTAEEPSLCPCGYNATLSLIEDTDKIRDDAWIVGLCLVFIVLAIGYKRRK